MVLFNKSIKKTYLLVANTANLPVHAYISSVDNTVNRSISIAKENSSNKHYNILIYLWTKIKPPQEDRIITQIGNSFSKIIFLELPTTNQRINLWSIKKIYNIYNNLLDDEQIKFLTAFSFERHYALLYDMAEKKNIYTVLSEEGTASYRYLIKDESYLIPKTTLKEHLLVIYQRFWKNGFIDRIIRYIIKDIKGVFKMYHYIFNIESIHYLFLKNHGIYKSFCYPRKEYSELHLDYPELLTSYFKADNITYSTIPNETENDSIIKEIIAQEGYNEQSVFCASQLIWGLNNKQSYNLLIPIFQELSEKYQTKIIIKPHPKENRDLIRSLIEPYSEFISLMPECPYPMERIIYFSKPKAVISIGSSTLVYGKLSSEKTEFMALAEALYSEIIDAGLNSPRIEKFFGEIIPMMKLFPHIQSFETSKENLENLQKL